MLQFKRFIAPVLTSALVVLFAAPVMSGPASSDDSWNPFRQLGDEPRPPRRATPGRQEVPSTNNAPGGQDQPTYPAPDLREDTPETAPAPLKEVDWGVERGELAPVLAGDGSGLPFELWRGLDAASAEGLIGKLDIPPKSPILHSMWRRLITSDSGGVAEASARFASLRADALYRSGLVSDAALSLSRLPDGADTAASALAARIDVANGDRTRGCERLKPLLGRKSDLPKPRQVEVLMLSGYCAAAGGNPGGAGLAAELIREDRLDDPAALAALDAAAGNGKAQARGGKTVTLLHYRLHELGGGIETADVLQRGEPALVARLAMDANTEAGLRLGAGEAAARANSIRSQDLGEIYRAAGRSVAGDTLLSAAGRRTNQAEQSQHRAGLLKAAEGERTPIRKLRLVRALLDDVKRAGLYWQGLELSGPLIEGVQPVPELSWFAESGVEIGLVTGKYGLARQWAALGGAVPGDGGLRHWQALIDLADSNLKSERGSGLPAVEDLAVRGRLSPDLLHRLATVLDAVDVNVPIPLWESASRVPQPTTGHLPDTGVLSELQEASKKKEFGRTVLLVMRTLGPNGAEGANIIALGDSIRALRRAGLEADARRLGLEALFAQWPRGAIN